MKPVRRYLLKSGQCVDSLPELNIAARAGFFARFGGDQLVLSRARCSFRRRRLQDGGLSGEKLRRALYLEAIASSPYPQTGVFIDLHQHYAGIWTWDASSAEAASSVPTRKTLPETVLHSEADGGVLRQTLDGYEGQFWQDGQLLDSRWWARPPDAAQWRLFYLSAEELGIGPSPRPQIEMALSADAEAPDNNLSVSERIMLLRPIEVAALIGALILLPTLMYSGLRQGYLTAVDADMRARYQKLEQENSGDRQTVASARRMIADIRFFSEYFDPQKHPLPPFADVIEVLTSIQAKTERLRYDRGEFVLDLSIGTAISQTDVVRSLESLPHVVDVRMEPGSRSGRWRLVFQASPAPPVPPAVVLSAPPAAPSSAPPAENDSAAVSEEPAL